MLRKSGMVFAGMVAVVVYLGTVAAADKEPTIKEIMKSVAGTKTEKGLCGKAATAGKDGKWDDAQKLAKDLKECGTNLAKIKCPKGDADSWDKLTKKYVEQTTAIAKATDDKDAKALETSVKAFTGSCMDCHKAHK